MFHYPLKLFSHRINFAICFILTGMCLLSGCAKKHQTPLSKSDYLLNTVVTISIYQSENQTKDTETILDDCMIKCKEYENLFSRTISGSDIYRINENAPDWVTVSEDTSHLLKAALSYCTLTNGLIDITIAPVKDLWNFSQPELATIPEQTLLSQQLTHVDYQKVELKDKQVRLVDENASLDLGFIAKGYIADRLKDYLISQGVTSAIINLGGNVLTIGSKNGSPFSVGIQKPFEDHGVAILSVDSLDSSVVTSGIYERYFSLDDNIYHHILTPTTGFPVENDLLSVTILSKDSVTGDALSTSCLLLGLEKGRELIESLEEVEAIFVTKNYEIIKTY